MVELLLSSFLASIAAGIPDVFAAAALSRAPTGRVLQMIASGVLGEASYTRGAFSMALGLGLQIAMSFVIALIYNIAFARQEGIRQNPLLCAALYGVVIFIVMNFVVVPLSRAHPKHRWDLKSVIAMLIVMILFAEIIALIAMSLAHRA
jgi:uncharacterized membrane protein YagU involved in acid resistance